jgi:hypothetical protein
MASPGLTFGEHCVNFEDNRSTMSMKNAG